jgi:drug/metabolite transporter (DMT)-like permease
MEPTATLSTHPEPAIPNRVRTAVIALCFCCIFWGLSVPVMKLAVGAFERHVAAGAPELSTATIVAVNASFNGWRFLITTLIYWGLTRKTQRKFTRRELQGGVAIGVFFGLGMQAQIAGLRYTLPSISGFLTALVVVFAPIAQAFIFRKRVGLVTWVAVAIAFLGILILSQPNPGAASSTAHLPPIPYLGEALTIFGSMLFTGQLLALDRYGQDCNTTRLTLLMFLVTGALSTVLGILLAGSAIYSGPVLLAIVSDSTLQLGMLGVIFFSSVIAMHLMNTYQPFLNPATASVIYCLEPVFATLFSVLFGTEFLTATTLAGGAMILLGVLVVTRKPKG